MAGVGITPFALAAGELTGSVLMGRLGGVNAATGREMAGNPSERLATIGISREIDQIGAFLAIVHAPLRIGTLEGGDGRP